MLIYLFNDKLTASSEKKLENLSLNNMKATVAKKKTMLYSEKTVRFKRCVLI